MIEPINLSEHNVTSETVLGVIRYRDGMVIQQIARGVWPDRPPSYWARLLKVMLTHLHREGRIETYRERSGSPLRYRKPDPLDWPDLSALHELVQNIDIHDFEPSWLKRQLVAVRPKLQAMIDSHAEVEAERIKNWVNAECIWRVEFNKAHGQTPRVNYVEASEGDTEQDVRRWQNMCVPTSVYIMDCRRADELDIDELLEMIREEEGW